MVAASEAGNVRKASRTSLSLYPRPMRASRTSDTTVEPLPLSLTEVRTGNESRFFNSSRSRSAVFLPTPGTKVSAPTSDDATMSTSADGECVDRMAMARAGPTPWVAMRVWKVDFSSRLWKPKRVCRSSRMW